MSKKLRWGILSTAWINVALVPAIQRSRRSKLVALASRDLKKSQIYAQEHGIPIAYGNYESLIDDDQIDVIYNPLPNALHCEWTVKAAQSGKHVLCEKPMALSLAELRAIEDVSRENNVWIVEAYAYMHHPQLQRIIELIESNDLGDIYQFTGWDTFPLPDSDSNYRFDVTMGGGSLWDIGVYPVSLAIVLNRSECPIDVWALQTKGETGVDLAFFGQMRFASGLVAHISSSFRSPERRGARIVGSKGILRVADHLSGQEVPGEPPGEGVLALTTTNGYETTIIIPAVDAYQREVEAMERLVMDGTNTVVPLSLSRDILRTIDALHRSASSGERVHL